MSSQRAAVGQETLNRIKPGETTDGWLLSVLGRPVSRDRLSGGESEIWRYEFAEVHSHSGSRRRRHRGGFWGGRGADVLPVSSEVIYVQFAHGVVTDWWRE